jgi:hypothetical protein
MTTAKMDIIIAAQQDLRAGDLYNPAVLAILMSILQ